MKACPDLHWDIGACRASVQTDSLTVLTDLSKVLAVVGEQFCAVLGVPATGEAEHLPTVDSSDFTRSAKSRFDELCASDVGHGYQFATLLSAFIHEARHVHDFRATRIGCELLLQNLKVYSGVTSLTAELQDWQRITGRPVPLPLDEVPKPLNGAGERISAAVAAAMEQRTKVETWWTTPSRYASHSGSSIRSLFECMGFLHTDRMAGRHIW